MIEVEDEDPAFLRLASSLDISNGSTVAITGKEPYGGLVRLRVGKRNIVTGTEAAARVRNARNEVRNGYTDRARTKATNGNVTSRT